MKDATPLLQMVERVGRSRYSPSQTAFSNSISPANKSDTVIRVCCLSLSHLAPLLPCMFPESTDLSLIHPCNPHVWIRTWHIGHAQQLQVYKISKPTGVRTGLTLQTLYTLLAPLSQHLRYPSCLMKSDAFSRLPKDQTFCLPWFFSSQMPSSMGIQA